MAKVSISEAARLAGISRQHLYKKWLTPGLLTVEKDVDSAPMIDTSELLRVFGELKGDSPGLQESTPDGCLADRAQALEAELRAVRALLADREAQLQEAREREAWLKQHVTEVTGALRPLEDKSETGATAARLKKALETITKYKQALEDERQALDAERSKGLWARLFG